MTKLNNFHISKTSKEDFIFSPDKTDNCDSCSSEAFILDNGKISEVKDCTSCGVDFVKNYGEISNNLKEKTGDLFTGKISNIDYKNNIESVCKTTCNLIENKSCSSNCNTFYKSLEENISEMANKNTDKMYEELSKYLEIISEGELKINFYDNIEINKEKILKYFDFFSEGNLGKQSIDKILSSYNLLNKFFAINHGNVIQYHDLYDIIEELRLNIKNFAKIGENSEGNFYNKEDLDNIKNIYYRFGINHSHLRRIDTSSLESEIRDRNIILNNEVEGLLGARSVNFGGHSEHFIPATNSFLINYIYGYGEMLKFIKKNNLSTDVIESDYFNFNDEKLSIDKRNEALYDYLLELLKNKTIDSKSNTGDIGYMSSINDIVLNTGNIDNILNTFILQFEYYGYNSVDSLEVIHHILSLFPEKLENKDILVNFGEKLLLNTDDKAQDFNIMKLRVINLVLRNLDLFENYGDNVLNFLKKLESNIEIYGTGTLPLYSSISLNMSKLYSEIYKKNKDENIKYKTINSLSFYSKLFGSNTTSEFNYLNNYENKRQSIINNTLSDIGKNMDNDLLELFYSKDEEIISQKIENTILKLSLDISTDITSGDFDFEKIDSLLEYISNKFFKNVCEIKLSSCNDTTDNGNKFYNEEIKISDSHCINLNVDKNFIDFYKNTKKKNAKILINIVKLIGEFIEGDKKIFNNKITGLKNGNSLNGEIQKMSNKEEEGSLIVIEFDKVFYNNGDSENDNKIASENITKKHAEIIKNLPIDLDYYYYHLNNNKFAILCKGGIKYEEYIKNIQNSLSELNYDNLLGSSISGFGGKIDSTSLGKCKGDSKNLNNEINIKDYNEIKDVIDNRPNDIRVYLQPIVDTKGDVDKYECLTRIKKKDGSIMAPYFIFKNISPYPNLYYKFTALQIERSFEIIKNKGKNLSINLSTQDLSKHGGNLILKLKELINKYGSDYPSKITFEVLEDSYDDDGMFGVINKIKKMGFKIAIDDFGAGQSSPIRIGKMLGDLDNIKLDADFVKLLNSDKITFKKLANISRLFNSESSKVFLSNYLIFHKNNFANIPVDKKLIKTIENIFIYSVGDFESYLKLLIENKDVLGLDQDLIIKLSTSVYIINQIQTFQSQNFSVICEYIENEDVKDIFTLMGTDLLQGYYFSKPFDADKLQDSSLI